MATKHVPAGEFKAKFLALLDEVEATGEEIIVTKCAKPVARVVPALAAEGARLQGSILCQGDLVSPIDVEWEATG